MNIVSIQGQSSDNFKTNGNTEIKKDRAVTQENYNVKKKVDLKFEIKYTNQDGDTVEIKKATKTEITESIKTYKANTISKIWLSAQINKLKKFYGQAFLKKE